MLTGQWLLAECPGLARGSFDITVVHGMKKEREEALKQQARELSHATGMRPIKLQVRSSPSPPLVCRICATPHHLQLNRAGVSLL